MTAKDGSNCKKLVTWLKKVSASEQAPEDMVTMFTTAVISQSAIIPNFESIKASLVISVSIMTSAVLEKLDGGLF